MIPRAARARKCLGGALVAVLLAASVAGGETNPVKAPAGFSYHHDEIAAIPWSIHVVKVDRANADFQLHSMMAKGNQIGLVPISEQVRGLPNDLGRPVAAINGDFYDNDTPYRGDPKGLQIFRGELVSAPGPWTCLWVDASGDPHMGIVASKLSVTWPDGKSVPVGLNERRVSGTAVLYTRAVGSSTFTRGGRELVLEKAADGAWLPLRAGEEYTARVKEVREKGDAPLEKDSLVLSLGSEMARRAPKLEPGAILKLSMATSPDLKGAITGLSGGPALVRNGKIQSCEVTRRHPRAAMGWNKQFIFLVEVDGRQRNLSAGMTYAELAKYMADLGCEEALNLDGGGSATIWVRGQIANSPSEGTERGIANGLVIIQKAKTEPKPLSSVDPKP
ncbi:MAG TPA: phosphodiester glycosidase family protein [Verrucomicrobiae bacterium]|nr:phosphodiester glycosidase family protein [Verrucomicrobiae bacterium]